MNSIKPVWIDTDTGVDDAFALLTAFKLDDIDIKGISAVCGNVELEKTFRNARAIASLAGREDIKVYKGAEKPFVVPLHCAYNVHGEDGLGGAIIPDSKAPIEEKAACDALYECAKELEGNLHIVAIGPLTNIATTILKYPDFVEYVKEIDMMGGSVGVGGNSNTTAEFNIFGDPHAAQTVFKSGIPIVMFGLDVTMKSTLSKEEVESLNSLDNPVAKFLTYSAKAPMTLYKTLGLGEVLCLHDTCPLAYLSDPDLFAGKKAGVYVETQSTLTLGKTVSDIFIRSDDMFPEKNVLVILDVDRDKLAEKVLNSYKSY